MSRKPSWTPDELVAAVKSSKSYRAVIIKLGLIPAGGNYVQIQFAIKNMQLDTKHFTGARWNKGLKYNLKSIKPVEEYLMSGSTIQSYKLKAKLFQRRLKTPKCELCGWAEKAPDGRIPVELDHINGVHNDNRLDNLRILCPNCHSLQPTHRGRNKKVALRKFSF